MNIFTKSLGAALLTALLAESAVAQFGQTPGSTGAQTQTYSGSTTTQGPVYQNIQPVRRPAKRNAGNIPASTLLPLVDMLTSAGSDTTKAASAVDPDFTKWADSNGATISREDWIRGRGNDQEGAPDLNDPNFNFERYSYPQKYRFYSGSAPAGDIGNGLCTESNRSRVQVASGYCQSLREILAGQQGQCAHKALNQILNEMDQGKDFGIAAYCPNFSQISRESRGAVFQQILAGLITQESGWNKGATEPGWYKGSQLMQGKGLFQIGTWDSSQDKDCEGISSSIYDPTANMKCGACIGLKNVARDGVIASGSNDSNSKGLAAYFGPMRDGQARKRSQVQRAVATYCASATTTSVSPASGDGAGGVSNSR